MQPGPPKWRHSSVAPRRLPPVPLDDPVARNKVSTRCFWNACKALSFGLLLMVIGTAMATIGYYADQLSASPPLRSNTTVPVKSRGFHLHNFTYAGPIVMGVGGFIVVAACVMTFEARDSAAKVVPTRLKYSASNPHRHSKLSPAVSNKMQSSVRTDSRRSTTKWEQSAVYRSPTPATEAIDRRALTAAFIQFSKNLHQAGPVSPGLSKSPSAPNLAEAKIPIPTSASPYLKSHISPRQRQKRMSRNSLHPSASGCTLLSPRALLQRQALSMDNPDYNPYFSPPRSNQLSRQHSGKGSKESLEMDLGAVCQAHGSQASMQMDLHVPNDCPVTLRVRDKTKRSDTAKRHAFVRQTQITVDEDDTERRETHSCSPRLPSYHPRAYDEIRPYSRSTPHSRRESLTKVPSPMAMLSMDEQPRSRSNTGESRRSSLSKRRYSRTNTEEKKRRGSTTSEKRVRSCNVSRSSSYEKRRTLEGQFSSCSGKSEPNGESGSDATPDELDKKSDTYVVIEEVDVQLPTVSCSGVGEEEYNMVVEKPGKAT